MSKIEQTPTHGLAYIIVFISPAEDYEHFIHEMRKRFVI